MRTIFILCGLILVGGIVFVWVSFRAPSEFGELINAPRAETIDVINHPENYLHTTVQLEGIIAKQCTTMGCYFFFIVGEKELRIDLADIAMNAPKRKDGRRALVEGRTVPFNKGYELMASYLKFE